MRRSGFTIIELLVVIAIIGLLTTGVLVFLDSTRTKSRDTRRMSDMQEIGKALGLYIINNDNFPVSAAPTTITGDDAVSTALEGDGVIVAMPTDPRHPTLSYTYQSDSAGRTYVLTFCLETDTIPGYAAGCDNTITP